MFLSFFCIGQTTINIKGKVLNRRSKSPVAYASIFLPATYYGTVKNVNGDFSLNIPLKYIDNQIVVRSLGYKNDSIPVSSFSSCKKIFIDETHTY